MSNIFSRNYNKKVVLQPGEYKSISKLRAYSGSWLANNGLIITKDSSDFCIKTPFTVDEDCEIEVQYNEEKHYGKVRYIKSSSRRKYYMCLKYYLIILQILAIIATIYEIEVLGNYIVEGSQAENLRLPMGTWLGFDIIIMRNMNSITKWIITIFAYMVVLMASVSFIAYLAEAFA